MSEPVIPAKITPIQFASMMQRELAANIHKGDWYAWHPTPSQAFSELDHHSQKLREAVIGNRCERIIEFSADVANICMKIAESFGEVSQ